MDFPTDQPPPYSSLQNTSSLSTTPDTTPASQKEPHVNPQNGAESLIYEEWVYYANSWPFMWSRRSGTISPDHVNVSYGIDNDAHHPPLHNEPDIFFTCRFQPRSGDAKDKFYINMYCCIVTAITVLHREAGGRSCDCNWWTLNYSSRGCLLRPRGLLWIKKWWRTRQLRQAIWDHDRLCSCGCFDITRISESGKSSRSSISRRLSPSIHGKDGAKGSFKVLATRYESCSHIQETLPDPLKSRIHWSYNVVLATAARFVIRSKLISMPSSSGFLKYGVSATIPVSKSAVQQPARCISRGSRGKSLKTLASAESSLGFEGTGLNLTQALLLLPRR
ncbi:hypothetical protein KCU87_g517, partial [Aureobasidium melanogenum]